MDQVKNKVELEKKELIAGLEDTLETIRQNAEQIKVLEKSWHESEWYLGEARARAQRLDDELRDKDHHIRKLEAERQSAAQLEAALKAATARCQDLERQIEKLEIELQGES